MFKKLMVFFITILFMTSTLANPMGGRVASGSVKITYSPTQTTIIQKSQKAVINWKSFNINAKQKTSFIQPKNGVVLNRVNSKFGASKIYGVLDATGRIILINQAGVYFGPGSKVNVGGIIVSTSDMTNKNFNKNKYIFDQPSPYPSAIVNEGKIRAKQHGLVALVSHGVANDGTIEAKMGNVVLASGEKFTFDLQGDQLVNFSIDAPSTKAGVDSRGNKLKSGVRNSGIIIADGGTIRVQADIAEKVVDQAINMSGVVQAQSVHNRNGVIILAGDSDGQVQVSGKVDVSGPTARGGKVKILGKHTHITASAEIDASGRYGGGEILIGGNYQGKGPESNALTTKIDQGAKVKANATQKGNGGKIIVWADDTTKAHGDFNVSGGPDGGNGGFIETSGKQYLDINDATFNLSAPNGKVGTLLLDPANITINNGANSNIDCASTPGTCQPTSGVNTSVINATNLMTALGSGNIIIDVHNIGVSGIAAGNITISAGIPLTWSAATSLTLNATNNINIGAGSSITALNGQLILNAPNTITIASSAPINVFGMAVNSASTANFNSATITIGPGNLTLNTAFAILNGIVTGSGGLIVLGTDVALNIVAKTYTGSTVNSGGTLRMQIPNAIVNSSSVTNNGFILLQGNDQTFNNLSGSGSIIGNNFGSANLTLNNTVNTSYSGDISTLTSSVSLIKSGSGRLSLSGPNTYDGTTTINGGTLEFASASSLPAGQNININSGILATASSGPTSITNTLNLSGSAGLSAANNLALNGTINGGGADLTLSGSGSIRFNTSVSGALNSIHSSTSNLVLNNGGFTTTNAQTYSGLLTLLQPTALTIQNGTISTSGVSSAGFPLIFTGTSGQNQFNISGSNSMNGAYITINAIINSPITIPFGNNTLNFIGYNQRLDIVLNDVNDINKGILKTVHGETVAAFSGITTAVGNTGSELTVSKGNPNIIYDPNSGNGQVVDPFYFYNIFPTQFVAPMTTETVVLLPNSVIYQPTTNDSLEIGGKETNVIFSEVSQNINEFIDSIITSQAQELLNTTVCY